MNAAREGAELGGLASYGVNLPDPSRATAIYLDKIIKGVRPAELPIQQPTKFELVINLKTAKPLGLTISRDFCSMPTRWSNRSPMSTFGSFALFRGKVVLRPLSGGGLNRSTQHFILKGKDGALRWIEDFIEDLQPLRRRSYGIAGSEGSR
jgi:hypothetical protein